MTPGQILYIQLLTEYTRQGVPKPYEDAHDAVRESMQRGLIPFEKAYK